VVDQPPHHAVILAGFRWGGDGQQQRLLAFAGAGGHRLERVVGDHVELVHDGEGRVPPLQGARVGRQREQGRVAVWLGEVVGVDLHPGV
jgi:hypothetical protein